MDGQVLSPPPVGRPFFAGSLQRSALSRTLGIKSLFGSCGAEAEDHNALVDLGAIWILLITLKGGGIIRSKRKSYEVGPMRMLVVPPSVRFTEHSMGPGAWRWIHLRFGLKKNSPISLPVLNRPWVGLPNARCLELTSEIIESLHNRVDGYEHVAVSRLIELLGITARLIACGEPLLISAPVEKACSLMSREPGKAWKVTEIARLCGMSYSSFAHHFKAEVGESPMQWLGKQRIREARRMLAEQRAIEDVAEHLGYSSRYHFTSVFTKAEGLTPGVFQRLSKRR